MAIRKAIFQALTLLLLAGPAVAALPEIPCNGIDDDGAGGDQSGPVNDADCDGFTLDGTGTRGYDCDDTNSRIPAVKWVMTGCSGQQVKVCNILDGTYSACGTPSNTGSNYYLDFDDGSNSNDCSFATPCKDHRMVDTYYDSGDRPAGWKDLAAQTTVWFLDNLDTSTFLFNGQKRGLNLRNESGTAGSPIRFVCPIGSGAGISPTGCNSGTPCPAVTFETSDYVEIYGCTISGGYGDGVPIEGSGIAGDADYGKIIGNDITANFGSPGSNTAGINLSISPIDWTVTDNLIHNNYDTTAGTAENERQAVFFTPTGLDFGYNRVYMPVVYTDSNDSASGVVIKHGNSTGSNRIHHNIMWQLRDEAIGGGGAGLTVERNLIVNSERWIWAQNFGGVTYTRDWVVQDNTIYSNLSSGGWAQFDAENNSGGYGTSFIGRRNVYVVADTGYGDDDAVVTLGTYQADAVRTAFLSSGIFQWNQNCYYNSAATTLQFCDYCNNSTGGPTGTLRTYAQWQSLGLDAASFVKNPVLDTTMRATDADCDDWGWLRVTEFGGGSSSSSSSSTPPGPSEGINTKFKRYSNRVKQ